MVSSSLEDHIGPPRSKAVKSRIWTSQPKAGAQHWRREDVRSVLPHRPRRRDLRRTVDTADHPQPVPRLRRLQRNTGGCAGLSRTCSHNGSSSSNGSVSSSRHPSQTGAGTTTSSRLRATACSRSASRSASGVRVGSNRPREPRPFCGPLVDVPRAPSRPAPGSTRRHPLRLPCPAERVARLVHRSAQRKGGRWNRPPAA